MSQRLVAVEKVSKKFCRSLRRSLWYGMLDMGAELLGRNGGQRELRADEFWAVRDVSLELQRGETLGLIGHNGAGKTTLLRMLNGLIKPDAGRIEIRGRMQALIALGAGFNPILTGRENVYVNAAVLGIPKAEIDRRFDAIVDFAGIGRFIDSPVQSYSSGMAVRLGFAVAAHLDPDILLVDEVLAVGDLAFQAKCRKRIQELRQAGVALILVSHNLHTVSHLCTRTIVLGQGRVVFDGETDRAIDIYRAALMQGVKEDDAASHPGTGELAIRRMQVLDANDREQNEFNVGDTVKLRLHYRVNRPVAGAVINIKIRASDGDQVTGMRSDSDGVQLTGFDRDGYVDVVVPQFNLLPDVYTIDAVLFHADGFAYYDRINHLASVKINGGLQVNGTVYLPHTWGTGASLNSQPADREWVVSSKRDGGER